MQKNKEQAISTKYIFFLISIIAVSVWYISLPDKNVKIHKNKTFEERLEYSNSNIYRLNKIADKELDKIYINNENNNIETENKPETIKDEYNISDNSEYYNKLLDSLQEYPPRTQYSIENIVNKLIAFKGYPLETINIIITDLEQTKSKTQGHYQVAQFDFVNGDLYITQEVVYKLDTKNIIAILAHEIDHFDKLAKLCKYMGIEEFSELFYENNIENINKNFWNKAAKYANIDDFNGDYYKRALLRFITQNNLEQLSSYSNFYKLSESIRNPLEISAYKASDYVYNYFKIPIVDGPIKKLIKIFNDVDWSIYNMISKNPLIKNQRIALFDYFFAKAILQKFPDLNRVFENCINQKNSDLTEFWNAFESKLQSFYKKGKMDQETYDAVVEIMTQTYKEVAKGASEKEIANAIKYKINTQLNNITYPNALQTIKNNIIDYLTYTKENNINKQKDELKYILTLICIENELYKHNQNKEISLYYLKMPEELVSLYEIAGKKQRYFFIYNNDEFKNLLGNSLNEQYLLVNLINQNRINIKQN